MNVLERMGFKKEEKAPLRAEPQIEQKQPLRGETLEPLKETFKDKPFFSDGEHIKGLFDDYSPAEFDEIEHIKPANDLLSKDHWGQAFAGVFSFSGSMTGLETLKAVSYEDAATAEAFGALYDTFEEIPALNFLLSPGGKWTGRIMAIGMFSVPLYLGVQAELQHKREATHEPPKEPVREQSNESDVDLNKTDQANGEIPAAFIVKE